MKKITLFIFVVSLLLASCTNNKNDMIAVIDFNEIQGKPEYMLFKTENEGYMFCYKGGLYQNSSIFVYKTTNGGKNWEQIYYQNGYYFSHYSTFTLFNNVIYGTIDDPENIANYNLFKLDLATQEFKLINPNAFGVDRVGGIIGTNGDNISVFFYKKEQRGILTTSTDFSSFSLMRNKTPAKSVAFAALVLVLLTVALPGCKQDNDDPTLLDKLAGVWTSDMGEKYTISSTKFTSAWGGDVTYEGTIVNVREIDSTSGYITIKLTAAAYYPESVGNYYVIHFRDLTSSTMKIAGAGKMEGDNYVGGEGESTQAAAETRFTVQEGYFDGFSDVTK